MGKFAVGKNAYGISDRSGFRYKLNEMKREWNGLLVGKDEWEKKQPQLEPRRTITDPQALRNPRPDRVEPMNVYVGLPTPEAPNLRPVTGFGQVGSVTITGTSDSTNVTVSGVTSTGSVGSVTVTVPATAPSFDSALITFDSTTETFDEG